MLAARGRPPTAAAAESAAPACATHHQVRQPWDGVGEALGGTPAAEPQHLHRLSRRAAKVAQAHGVQEGRRGVVPGQVVKGRWRQLGLLLWRRVACRCSRQPRRACSLQHSAAATCPAVGVWPAAWHQLLLPACSGGSGLLRGAASTAPRCHCGRAGRLAPGGCLVGRLLLLLGCRQRRRCSSFRCRSAAIWRLHLVGALVLAPAAGDTVLHPLGRDGGDVLALCKPGQGGVEGGAGRTSGQLSSLHMQGAATGSGRAPRRRPQPRCVSRSHLHFSLPALSVTRCVQRLSNGGECEPPRRSTAAASRDLSAGVSPEKQMVRPRKGPTR